MYSMEWSLGAEIWSGVLEWSQILEFSLGTVHSMMWSLGAEYWSGVESDFGVAKVEWSAVVMCVCPSFM